MKPCCRFATAVPELPEVEVVRRGLHRWVRGRTIARVHVALHRAVRRSEYPLDVLCGRTITSVQRRGKFLWMPLDSDDLALVAHLGMSGQLVMQPDHAEAERHMRIRFGFRDAGRELRFVDQRTFGWMSVEALVHDRAGRLVPGSVTHIAPDPFDGTFDLEGTVARIRSRRTEVKRALLDQTVVSGIGNIYADEGLWAAGIHGRRRTDALPAAKVRGLMTEIAQVMDAALEQGGTSFDSLYVNVNGESGYFERWLNAYGREGEPCPRCGNQIRRENFMNRSSYFCPRCQAAPRASRPIAARRGR